MNASWLHVSDFHFRAGDPYDRDVVLRALVKSVKDFRESGRAPDLLFAQEGHRLPMLTAVRIPEGVTDARVRAALLNEHNIEIGGGLGPVRGQVWRVGLMGHSSTAENVLLFLSALEQVLAGEGFRVEPGAGTAAARETLSRERV